MTAEEQLYKRLYRIGFVAYGVLMAFAMVFFKERTVFVDIAFHLFHIIKNNDFAIQAYRYGAVVTQVFPMLARKMSASLTTIMLVYSAGVMLYYIACYWLCGSVLKNYRLALVLLFSQFLFTTNAFFWMQAELQQGLAFMIVVFGFVGKLGEKPSASLWLLTGASIIFANFFHPLLFVPFFFVAIFFLANKHDNYNKLGLLLTMGICIAMYFVKKQYFSNPYDEQTSKGVNNFLWTFPHYWGIASNRKFLADCLNKFYWIPVTAAAICIYYTIRRKWLFLALFLPSFIGFLLLVNVSFPHNAEVDFYMENLYLPLGIIIALPLVYHLMPYLYNRRLAYPITIAILLTGLVRIYMAGTFQTDRIKWQRAFLQQNGDKKMLISSKIMPMEKLKITWGTAYEFWLLSTSEQGKSASIVIDDHVENLLTFKWENKEFLGSFEHIPYEQLTPEYFKFTDTVTHYEVYGHP